MEASLAYGRTHELNIFVNRAIGYFVTYSHQTQNTQLRLKSAGKTVWYDNAMLDKSTAAMEEGVKHNRCFVLFQVLADHLLKQICSEQISRNTEKRKSY